MKHLLHILEGRLQTLPVRMAVQLPAGQQLGARDAAVTLRFRDRMALVALASGEIGKVGAAIVEGKVALEDRVKLAEVRSPVRGTVNTLMANTVGGVVQPGKDILDIVPLDDTLLMEVQINPRDIGFLHFGRLRPLHTNLVIFAFGGCALMGTSFYVVQRTCHTRLFSDALAAFVFWGWQLVIVLAAITLPLGFTQGKEYAELEWPIDILIALVWVAYAIVFFGTIWKRKVSHIYVANWFFLAFIGLIFGNQGFPAWLHQAAALGFKNRLPACCFAFQTQGAHCINRFLKLAGNGPQPDQPVQGFFLLTFACILNFKMRGPDSLMRLLCSVFAFPGAG